MSPAANGHSGETRVARSAFGRRQEIITKAMHASKPGHADGLPCRPPQQVAPLVGLATVGGRSSCYVPMPSVDPAKHAPHQGRLPGPAAARVKGIHSSPGSRHSRNIRRRRQLSKLKNLCFATRGYRRSLRTASGDPMHRERTELFLGHSCALGALLDGKDHAVQVTSQKMSPIRTKAHRRGSLPRGASLCTTRRRAPVALEPA